MNKLLTKTDFILYRDCAKNVWIKWHKPEEYNKFEISAFEQALGVMRNDVEELARNLFPGGYLIEKRNDGAQELTKKLISEHHPVIYQAVFSTDEYLATCDVLKWNAEDSAYDIYEIKMSSTDDEDEEEDEEGKPKKVDKKKELQYEYDIAFQVNIAKMCGVNFNKKYLVRLNKGYVRSGELDVHALFTKDDQTDTVRERLAEVEQKMLTAREYLNQENEPVGNCKCLYKTRRNHCTTFQHSNSHVPLYSIHDISYISAKKVEILIEQDILDINDIPDEIELTDRQRN